MPDNDARYNIVCPLHGQVQLGEAEYDRQMMRANDRWRCPKITPAGPCGAVSQFDDDAYEAGEPKGEDE